MLSTRLRLEIAELNKLNIFVCTKAKYIRVVKVKGFKKKLTGFTVYYGFTGFTVDYDPNWLYKVTNRLKKIELQEQCYTEVSRFQTQD